MTDSSTPGRAPALQSPEFGLALGLVVGRFAIGMNDLHYGYWTDDLELTPQNLPLAQARYTDELMHDIPAGVRSVLDVGCGAGNTARKLLDRGLHVDCVSPNAYLTAEARKVLGGRARVFESKFEDLTLDRSYDLILFSESFLFMKAEPALAKAEAGLVPGGYILISDIFKLPTNAASPIGGGQSFPKYQALMGQSRFELLKDTDITERIAPTFDLLNRAYAEAIRPAYDLILARTQASYPWLMRVVRWKFRDKIRRYEEKHFSGKRDGAHFRRHKSYRRMLYRLRP
ncbi:MAG TPA: class I SAM-dependent methyltransferase [Gemmatimonadales bacterium]